MAKGHLLWHGYEMQSHIKILIPMKKPGSFFSFSASHSVSSLYPVKKVKAAQPPGVRLTVRLRLDAVYIDIQKVEVNVSGDTGTTTDGKTVNLLIPAFTIYSTSKNGLTPSGRTDLPAGTLRKCAWCSQQQFCCYKRPNLPRSHASSQQSGLKLNIHAGLTAYCVPAMVDLMLPAPSLRQSID